jgi:hypothetical protein
MLIVAKDCSRKVLSASSFGRESSRRVARRCAGSWPSWSLRRTCAYRRERGQQALEGAMPSTRWPIRVGTSCTIRSPARPSSRQAANRSISPSARSVAPSSNMTAFEAMAPPSTSVTSRRPSTGAKVFALALHADSFGEPSCIGSTLCSRGTFSRSEPRCACLWRDIRVEVAGRSTSCHESHSAPVEDLAGAVIHTTG